MNAQELVVRLASLKGQAEELRAHHERSNGRSKGEPAFSAVLDFELGVVVELVSALPKKAPLTPGDDAKISDAFNRALVIREMILPHLGPQALDPDGQQVLDRCIQNLADLKKWK